jgi:hypothetical protein
VIEEIKKLVDRLLDEPQQSDVRDGFLFIGHVATKGFHWDDDLRLVPHVVPQRDMPEGPWLVSDVPLGIPELSRRYSIFNEKTALRDFAKLPPTREALLQFANRYGHLLAAEEYAQLFYPEGKPDPYLWAGELLQFWIEAIREMNMLVVVWDMVKTKQIEALKQHIVWNLEPMYVKFVWLHPDRSMQEQMIIASKEESPELFNHKVKLPGLPGPNE